MTTPEMDLFEAFVNARIKSKETYSALQASIDEHSRRGELIVCGDLPEYKPASTAKALFYAASIEYADYIIKSRGS